MLVVLEALAGKRDVIRLVRVVDLVAEPDPVDAGPVIQVNADVVAGTSEQMADTAVDVVRSDLEDSRPFDEFPRWPSLGLL
ncbi:MAG: hypothetical protein QOD97_239 [Mycobacterium sp.]|nr:hypothetical protein [Mycobacterium sp.]